MASISRRAVMAAVLVLLCGCDGDGITTPGAVGTIVGSGVIASESRAVSGFTALTVSGPLRVVLRQTGSESLVVTADDNVIPRVRSEVRAGRLFLGFVPNTSLTQAREVVCDLTTVEVGDVEASGAARLEMSDLASSSLTVHLSGATTGLAAGTVEQFRLDVSGASRWSGRQLRSRAVTATVSGASYGLVRASDSLTAIVSGVSVLEYVGRPAVVSTVDGLSVVRQVDP